MNTWNGKFMGVGNTGYAGTISLIALGAQIRRGYAVVGTNTGHVQPAGPIDGARFAYEEPEQLIDYAYRAVHEVTVVGKALVQRFYGKTPAFSYWLGSSGGGKQGITEAQRYPGDYDGILAGSAPLDFTTVKAAYIDRLLAAARDSATFLPDSVLGVLHGAVLATCDALDGARDSILADPRRCTFSPESVRCEPGRTTERCLSRAQVAAAARIYDGLRHPRTGARIAHGLSVGSELTWAAVTNPSAPNLQGPTYFRWLVFRDSTWDWRSLDFSRDRDFQAWLTSEARYASVFNATNPDLSAFAARGGKLLQWHGWNDHQIPALNSTDYHASVVSHFTAGRDRDAALQSVDRFYRLFVAPGRGHGFGMPGPDYLLAALENWIERGIAPESITGEHPDGAPGSTQLLCPHPRVAKYSGSGNPRDAANFSCVSATRQ